jgi:hypothetical protein
MVARTKVLQRNTPRDSSVKDRTSCTENIHLGREDDIVKMVQVEGAKCINTWTHESEGATEPGRDGPGQVGPSQPAWPSSSVGSALSYGPPWAHCLGGYQDRLLGGSLGLHGLCHAAPDSMGRKDYSGEVLR